MQITKIFLLPLTLIGFTSCSDQVTIPKPEAYMALEYPRQEYSLYENKDHFFSFEKNNHSIIKEVDKYSFQVSYPEMNATIFINYRKVNNNLPQLLKDAQKLTYEHFVKADEIIEQPYINETQHKYGMFYNIEGDAATNLQFYVTDSINNFLLSSLYFSAKPNYDSIYPAKMYIEKDMLHLIETLQWNLDKN